MKHYFLVREPLLTVAQAATLMNLSPSSVYNMIRDYEIPFVKLRGRYMIPEKEYVKWIRRKTVGG